MREDRKWPLAPWEWFNSETDEPFDFSAEWDGYGYPSLRTVEQLENKYGYMLPDFILDADPGFLLDAPGAASLLKAAPELYDALVKLGNGEPWQTSGASDALAKAEGES